MGRAYVRVAVVRAGGAGRRRKRARCGAAGRSSSPYAGASSNGRLAPATISTPAWIVRPTLVDRLVPGTEGSWTARRSCPRVRGPPLTRRVVAASRHLRGQRDGCRLPPGQLPLLVPRDTPLNTHHGPPRRPT